MTQRRDTDAASPSSTPAAEHPSPRRQLLTVAGRTIAVLLAMAVLIATGVGWVIHHRADTAMAAHQVDALVPDDPHILRAPATGPATAPSADRTIGGGSRSTAAEVATIPGSGSTSAGSQPVPAPAGPVTRQEAAAMPAENILILGLDTRGKGENGVGPGTSQSDVIMIAHLHAGHRSMSVLSIPRDLYVPAPACKQWDNVTGKLSDQDFITPYRSWKITNAYSVGGPQCTVKAVQGLTGVRIDRMIAIQFEGFKSIVDALGGVRMTFSTPVIDGHQGAVITRPGSQLVSGDQALRLVRSRTVKGDPSGDLGRIGRQQKLISAIMHQVSSSGLLSDPTKLDRVVQTFVAHSTVANVTIDRLLQLARTLGGGAGSVAFTTLPTVGASRSDGLQQAPQDQRIFAALAGDEPLAP